MNAPRLRPSPRAGRLMALMAALLVARTAAASVELCQKLIEKNTLKVEKRLSKALGKCTDIARKADVLGTSLATAAASCQEQLVTAITFPDASNTSALQAAKNFLDTLTTTSPPLCADADLLALGHLPTATFGDRWARWILIAELARAVEQHTALVRDARAIFGALAATGSCPLCAKLAKPPCFEQACTLAAASAAKLYAPALFSVSLSGEVLFDVCRYDDILPHDYALVGVPGKTINRSSVLSVNLCTRTIAAEGYVSCTGSTSPKVSYTACQDHIVNAPDIDECAGVGVVCRQPTSDPIPEHAGSTNGGSCLTLSSAPSVAGAAFALSSVEISIVTAADRGTDGVACTDDDTAPPPLAFTVPLTTASAQAFVFDGTNSPGNNFSSPAATGTAFSCSGLQSGNLAGTQLVGALPALHSLCLVQPCDDPNTVADEGNVPADTAINFTLICQ